MIREVEHLSQSRAEKIQPMPREAIISITGSRVRPASLRRGWTRVLRLAFDDVEEPYYNAVHFDDSHAEEVLAWLEKIEDKVDKVFVHCHAGISRSAAVARFISEKYGLLGGIRENEYHNQRVYRILTHKGRKTELSQ